MSADCPRKAHKSSTLRPHNQHSRGGGDDGDIYFDDFFGSSSGRLLETKHYYPYGREIRELGFKVEDDLGSPNPFLGHDKYGFAGEFKMDWANVPMQDFGARTYDSQIGRWSSMDPLADMTPDWTPYRYGFDSPHMFTDPSGMSEDWYRDYEGGYIAADGFSQGALCQELSANLLRPSIFWLCLSAYL